LLRTLFGGEGRGGDGRGGEGGRETGWGARQRESHGRERVSMGLSKGEFLLKCLILLSGQRALPTSSMKKPHVSQDDMDN
jgi:hypothetical protein